MENDLLNRIKKIVEEHLSDEQFGVSELAGELNMSRSNLLRKVRKQSGLSVSQLIRQIRLEHAMELLKNSSMSVSEISYKVGFGSVSYFVKCFGDHYGYPPGEVGKTSPAIKDDPSTLHTHQLAAIVFTDIEGYTALMQKDEKRAIELRNRHREVFEGYTKKYSGRILQYYGDGTLSTFSSAVDAVKCSIEMQLAFANEPKIPVRIGIHSGDIIFTKDDIIGDGVNIASRVESLAAAGSVFISGKIHDEVKNKSDIHTVSMGRFELKNVDKPIDVYAVSNPGLVVPETDQVQGKGKLITPAGSKFRNTNVMQIAVVMLIALVATVLIYTLGDKDSQSNTDLPESATSKKSIAVLPFRNESDDSSNIYIVNGLMEAILNNLQKIEDLRVISRTSVEKYRNASKTIAEISQELNAEYFVEGSGQKIGDQIMLNIQLIEAPNDQHLWAEQYARDTKDIFQLQQEVAKSIAAQIEVIITPEEQQRIEKIPTENLEAYDYFLQGLDQFYAGTAEGLWAAISYFEKAIELDPEFARAYADIAVSYYYLDFLQVEKQYTEEINTYADQALLIDAQLPQGMVAKALFYMANREYHLALPHLEKALEYNPNSVMVISILSEFYAIYSPNTGKYLEYALRGAQLDIASDSTAASITYLHLSNALIQSGFTEKAEEYIDLSLSYDPQNLFSKQVQAYILCAKDMDLERTKNLLLDALEVDSSRLDIVQEVAKICYYQRDYQEAYQYYHWFTSTKDSLGLGIFPSEDAKIALVLSKTGKKEQAARYIADFKNFAETDKSLYRHFMLAHYYAYQGDTEKAIENLQLFSQQDQYFYWVILFTEIDPVFDSMKELPEFKKIMKKLKDKFWKRHNELEQTLTSQGLL